MTTLNQQFALDPSFSVSYLNVTANLKCTPCQSAWLASTPASVPDRLFLPGLPPTQNPTRRYQIAADVSLSLTPIRTVTVVSRLIPGTAHRQVGPGLWHFCSMNRHLAHLNVKGLLPLLPTFLGAHPSRSCTAKFEPSYHRILLRTGVR
jgi:hypothetical protein